MSHEEARLKFSNGQRSADLPPTKRSAGKTWLRFRTAQTPPRSLTSLHTQNNMTTDTVNENADAVDNAEMQSLVSMLNKLQDATTVLRPGQQSPIDLPQMCVVGSQSSGKSSVLENIVGRSFLPRGSGIVTRRPLVLMMLQTQGHAEYAEFSHLPGKHFTTDAAIRAEIEADTERECGANKGLHPKPINLRFYSARVPNLTLIDLPGITQNPVGDQPDDIGAQIKQMVLEYVRRPNCIVLAVTAANTDLANSDAIAIARQVDAEG